MAQAYQTLIVDENAEDITTLSKYLGVSTMFDTPHITNTVVSAYQLLTRLSIDLVFLDMAIDGGSGIELLSLMPTHPPIIVMSTPAQYAVDCFDLDIADFIQKPYTFPRLYRAISRGLAPTQPAKITTVAPLVAPSREAIYLKIGRKTERFFLDEIQLIEAYGIYIKLHTKQNVFVVNEKISKIGLLLPKNQFIRIHKSSIINVAGITRIQSKAVYMDKVRLTIGGTFQDNVHNVLKQLAIEQ